MKMSTFTLGDMIRKATGVSESPHLPASDESFRDYLLDVQNTGILKVPFSLESVFWLNHRFPIWADLNQPVKRSQLINVLSDHGEDTALVVDSHRSAINALYWAKYTESGEVADWVLQSVPEHREIFIKTLGGSTLILATFMSFVSCESSG